MSAARAGTPYLGQARHVPDTALTGMANPRPLAGSTTPPGALQIPELLFEKPPVPGVNIDIIGGGGWKP
ncbi:MAG: hypothetical protein ACOYIG_05845 [Acetivibrionales bacterium]